MLNSALETFEAPQQNKYTDPLVFVPGEYTFSQVGRVPYLSSVMSLQDLVNQIQLVENIPEESRLEVPSAMNHFLMAFYWSSGKLPFYRGTLSTWGILVGIELRSLGV